MMIKYLLHRPRPSSCRWQWTFATLAILLQVVSSFDNSHITLNYYSKQRFLGTGWSTTPLPPLSTLFLSSSSSSSRSSSSSSSSSTGMGWSPRRHHDEIKKQEEEVIVDSPSRRTTLSRFGVVAAAAAATATTTASFGTMVGVANAAEEEAGTSTVKNEVLLRLKDIPTFCIVNSDGIPLMIFDGQASATGYFFLSFNVAKTVLDDARSKDKSKDAQDKWADATIISLPLTVALQLGLRKVQRKAVNNGILFNTYNDIVPSEEGVEDAKRIDRKNPDRWIQKGRVPIFYVEGLTVDEGKYSPRYFNVADLQSEWKKQYPDKDLSDNDIQIVEMVDFFRSSLSSSNNGSNIDSLQNIKFVPVVDSQKVASELQKKTSSTIKYNLKEVYLVQSAKG